MRHWAGLVSFALAAQAAAASRVEDAVYGQTKAGATVHVFTLSNDYGVTAKILDLGGIIAEFNSPDRHGKVANVVWGLPDLAAWERMGGINSLIGRYANRIKGGFTINGQHFELRANPRGVTLHSGGPAYGSRVWASRKVANANGAGVELSLVSPDGDQGFPGEMQIKVTYTLNDKNELRLDYEATTSKPTVATLTNHVYFNLVGNAPGTVYDQELQVMADYFTPTDQDQVPTGELAPVAGTALDFRKLKPIGQDVASTEPQMQLARGYDHNFVLRKPAGEALPLAVRMYDPGSGRLLEVLTTEPGVQIYSANNMGGGIVNATGTTLQRGYGLAIETEHYPDSPNKPGFPSTLLRPGEVLRSTTVFRMTVSTGRPGN